MSTPDEFERLVRRHHPEVIGLCLSILGDRAAAEDAAQDAFVKAYRSWEEFRGEAAFMTWMHRIATNVCLDALRKSRRRAESPLEAAEGSLEKDVPFEAADLAARLLAVLPEEQRVAVVLRETQGLSYEEIAEAMGTSLDSVKARLKRARQTLEEKLRHFSDPGSV